jgi:Cellulose binding domain
VMITNPGASAINGWSMQFNFAPKITTIWGASILEHSGSRYSIESDVYDAVIAPGQSVSFGFQAKPGRASAGPTDIVLNGVSLPLSPPGGQLTAAATFAVTGQSRSGIEATVAVTNMGTIPIGGWVLQFNYAPRITSVSGAAIVRHVGPVYLVRDAGYDGVIAPGASVSFRFKSSQRKLRSMPVEYSLDGVQISSS